MRKLLLLLVVALTVVAALASSARAASYPCYGAPPDYVAQFGASYPEPRVFIDNQSWWLEGPGDTTTSISDAMKAVHLHYGACFPFMETWDESSGTIRLDAKLQAHEYGGGTVREVGGLGFLDGKVVKKSLNWSPTTANEVRYVTLTRATSTITRCGRVESRMHVEGVSPNGHEKQFTSTGWQSIFTCKSGRSNSADRGPGEIGRSWYVGANYGNQTLADDFHGPAGLVASDWSSPTSRVKVALAAGTNRYLVAVGADIHGGSYGDVVLRGSGTAYTVNLAGHLSPGPNKVLFVACERVGSSTANPQGGQNCNAQAVPVSGG